MILGRLLQRRRDSRIADRLREIAEPIPPRAVPGCTTCAWYAQNADVRLRGWTGHIVRDHWRTKA